MSEQLVGRGMAADFAIHQPDKDDGGIPNPHFHVLCPIRPILENGKWGQKQRRVYRLDEDGNRIFDKKGKPLFDAVSTTDWGRPETLEQWRSAWAAMVNAKFAEKGLPCRIDHCSYARQGLDLIPTVHEGPAVRQMEAKGIHTDKGDLNRWLRTASARLKDLKQKIKALFGWLKEVREELSKPQSPTLADLLSTYYGARDAEARSNKGKITNLKQFADTVNCLTEQKLYTVDDLETRVNSHNEQTARLQAAMKAKAARKKELEGCLRLVEDYRRLKPLYDEWNAIKWKGRRERFKAAHEDELRQFYMARRKLEKLRTTDGKPPLPTWKRELGQLHQEYHLLAAEYKTLWDDMKKLLQVKVCVDTALRQQERPQARRRDMER